MSRIRNLQVSKSKRPCHSSWFKTYKWLHYVTKKLRSEKDTAFISKRYSNWKKAIEKFEDHQKSNRHKTAVSFEVTVRQS